jgi:predicted TIM-barrel fold metal-dependent hydrolase
MDRLSFIKNTAVSTADALLGKRLEGFVPEHEAISSPYDVVGEILKYPKIDAYAHAYFQDAQAKVQMDYADSLGIEKLFISVPIAKKMGETPDEIKAYNNLVLKAVKRHPDRLIGQLTINPVYQKESIEEIRRCTGEGMTGMKIYNQVRISSPLFYPVIEKFTDYKMIIHVHGESQLGVGGYRMKYDVRTTPDISLPEDFVDMAVRYPEAMFQYAHIGGGSDWEYACKAFRNYPNIYVDTGGSNNEENMLSFAVKTLGEDRVLFGCDGAYFQGVGKIVAADLTAGQKKKVFFDNYNQILKKSGRNIR